MLGAMESPEIGLPRLGTQNRFRQMYGCEEFEEFWDNRERDVPHTG